MLITITQCDMCGVQHRHDKDKVDKAWVQIIIQGIPAVPVVALTRDLCPTCVLSFLAAWTGAKDFPPQLWNADCKERSASQAKP
jgi:hypothetical protein